MFYHASQVKNIKELEPRISNHGIPLIYFSRKRENVLVYLSNAVEKYCKETGFEYNGSWSKCLKKRDWIAKTVSEEYENAKDHPEYRHFLQGNFPVG